MPTEFFVEALEPEIRWRHLWQSSYEARGRKYGLHVCRIVDGGSLGNRSGGSNSSSSGFSQGTSIALPAGGSGEPQWPLDLCHDRMASSDRSMRRRQDSHQVTHCFTFRGEPWKWQVTNSAWHTALVAAGIQDFRFHDLRHTWASWHRQAGTSCDELKDLGGWKSREMVDRYAKYGKEHLAVAATRIERFRAGNVGNVLTFLSRSQ